MQNILYLSIISVVLAVFLVMFLVNNQSNNELNNSNVNFLTLSRQDQDTLIGNGEGNGRTQEEADQIARANALKAIAEQIYVQVDSAVKLKETVINVGYEELYESIYTKIIETTAKAELYGVSYTVVEAKRTQKDFYVKVKAEVKASDAFQNFKAGLLQAIIKTLRDNRLVFTAKYILDKEGVENYNQVLPNVGKLLSEKNLVEKDYRKAAELIYLIKEKIIKTSEDILDVGSLFSELEAVAIDYPEELLMVKSKVYEFAKTLRLSLKVQKFVWKDEKVYIRLFLPAVSSYMNRDIKFLVISKNINTDSNIAVLRNCQGQIVADINETDSKLSFYFGGYEVASWTPRVFDTSTTIDRDNKDFISSSAIVWLLVDQTGRLLGKFQQDQITREFSTGLEIIFRNIFKENDLDIRVLDISYIERTFGNVEKLSINHLINDLRNYKMGRYLLLIAPNFNIGKVGSWNSLKMSVNLRIIDLMTNESFYDSISREILCVDALTAVRDIVSSQDFLYEFNSIMVKYLKF